MYSRIHQLTKDCGEQCPVSVTGWCFINLFYDPERSKIMRTKFSDLMEMCNDPFPKNKTC